MKDGGLRISVASSGGHRLNGRPGPRLALLRGLRDSRHLFPMEDGLSTKAVEMGTHTVDLPILLSRFEAVSVSYPMNACRFGAHQREHCPTR